MPDNPYAFYPHFTSFALFSLLLFYLLLCECHWFPIISECQTKKMKNDENFHEMNFHERINGNKHTLA